jgi:protein tyrosine phosphatase (PTP) superfamily phosphohydrolase (DUF442 family)
MAKIAKQQRRAARQRIRQARQAIADGAPPWARRGFGPTVNYLDMLLVDHGVFRLIYLNKHRLADDAWRSAQPAPHNIARLARQGIRTIINLRGPRYCGGYWLEQRACQRHGITLVDYQVRSRAAPTREEIWGAADLFERIEYPILMHCKSGADRAGLMSVLYLMLRKNMAVEQAMQQLSVRFGHFRQADTGILDAFFERYRLYNAGQPIEFIDWLENVYDENELKRSFEALSWANTLVNTILRRE